MMKPSPTLITFSSFIEEKGGSAEEKARITERLGDIKEWIGQFDVGIEYWDSALTQWSQLGDMKSVARLHAKMAHSFWSISGDKKRASEHHQMALEILEKEPENPELAGLYDDIGHRLWRSAEPEALLWIQKAFELAKKLGDSRVLAECYDDLGVLRYFAADLEEVSRYWEQGLKTALESNSVEAALRLYTNLHDLYWWTGEPQKALETVQKGLEFARKVGDLRLLVWLEGSVATTRFNMGEVGKAVSMYEDIWALVERTRNVTFSPIALYSIGMCYLWLGEWEKSLRNLTEAVNIAEKTGEYVISAEANIWLAELFMEMESFEKAEKCLKESNSVCEKARDTATPLFEVFPALSRLYLKKGEIDKAKEILTKMSEFVAKSKDRLLIANYEMLEGMLFKAQKNWEQSIQHLEKSLQMYKELNAQKWYVPYLTDLLSEYGSMYLERNKEGDKEQAFLFLNQALEAYEKSGAIKRAEKTRSRLSLKRPAQQPVKPEPSVVRLTTGHRDLDRLLSGGIPEMYAIALTAPPCDERSLLVKSFLESGAKKNEVTFYITIDPSLAKPLAEKFPSSFHVLVCNPQADAAVASAQNILKLRGVENLTDISIALTSAIRKADTAEKGPKRICIDLLSDVLLQHHAVQTRRWLTALITELKSKGFTTLGIIDPQIHPSEELHAVLGLFEGEISIFEKETEEGPRRYLKIKKMSNQKYLEDELPLTREDLD
jgi:tetratricopeptide (TPR) repeat protein